LRKCPTLIRVRGLTISGTGHPLAECGIKTKDVKSDGIIGTLFYLQNDQPPGQFGRFYFAFYFIIPIKILVFDGVYDIFLIGKKKHNEFNNWSEIHAASIFT
jgi:hypothetical protein